MLWRKKKKKNSQPYKGKRAKHWETVPPIIFHQMASASWPGSSRSCWSMLGVLFLIFQRWLAGRLVGWLGPGMERKEVWTGDDKAQDGWASKKGEAPKFFLFPPPLPVCGDLLIVQTCLQCKIRNKCVGSRGRWRKKRGSDVWKHLQRRRQKTLEQQESLHANLKEQQTAAIAADRN